MTIKLNGYNLTDDTIKQMKTTLRNSKQINKEMGFTLCADKKDNLHAGNMCTGERFHICIQNGCDEQKTAIGDYHTHQTGNSHASDTDAMSCGFSKIRCIGGKKTRCYIWQYAPMTIDKYNEFADLYNAGIKQIDDPVYKKNYECLMDFLPIAHTKEFVLKEKEERIHKFSGRPLGSDEITEMLKLIKQQRKIVHEMNKKTTEIVPKYYEEMILW